MQEINTGSGDNSEIATHEILNRVLQPQLELVMTKLNDAVSFSQQVDHATLLKYIQESRSLIEEMQQQVYIIFKEFEVRMVLYGASLPVQAILINLAFFLG